MAEIAARAATGIGCWYSPRAFRCSGVALDVIDHGFHRLDQERLVDPEVHLLAAFLALQHAGLAQEPEVMRHRRATERRHLHDLAYIQLLARFEREQNPLPVLVAERGVNL